MSSVVLTLVLSAALAHPPRAALAPATADTTRAAATSATRGTQERSIVQVDNRHFHQATVYLLQGARSLRLGVVNGLSVDSFVIPADVVRGAQPVRFAIRPLASRRATVSDQIVVTEGDTIALFVPAF